jgi:hypothetical protein
VHSEVTIHARYNTLQLKFSTYSTRRSVEKGGDLTFPAEPVHLHFVSQKKGGRPCSVGCRMSRKHREFLCWVG